MPEPEPRFTDFLAGFNAGVTDIEAARALAELMLACAQHDRSGSLTVTVKAKPEGGGVLLSVQIGAKPPVADPISRIHFLSADGWPVRSDPRQPRLATPTGDPAFTED
jgi:hypothetical protein